MIVVIEQGLRVDMWRNPLRASRHLFYTLVLMIMAKVVHVLFKCDTFTQPKGLCSATLKAGLPSVVVLPHLRAFLYCWRSRWPSPLLESPSRCLNHSPAPYGPQPAGPLPGVMTKKRNSVTIQLALLWKICRLFGVRFV